MDDLETYILNILNNLPPGHFVPALHIAKEIFGHDGRKKSVNPTLYKLKRKGLIQQSEYGTWGAIEK